MPRLLHMADVHLGARHNDLGPAAAAQRERQFGAFQRAIELAIAEKVDLVLISGDLFDSNSQPRRSVERAAAELGRLVKAHIPVVIIPGTHDCYEPSSIYRVFDIGALAGAAPDSGLVTVLTDTQGRAEFPTLDVIVHGRVFPTKRAPQSPLAGFSTARTAERGKPAVWQIGMIHGSLAVPGRFEQDEVTFTEQEVVGSGLHYLALGHWHSHRQGKAGSTVWAYPGAPEPLALDQDGAGHVLIVTLERQDGHAKVAIQPHGVGQTTFNRLELDAASVGSQADLERRLRELADKNVVLDVRLVGVKPEGIDLHVDELERQLQDSFMRLRIRDQSLVPLPDDPLAPADTIAGAFARDFGARIADHEARGETERVAELRESLRLGMLLLDDPQRVTVA